MNLLLNSHSENYSRYIIATFLSAASFCIAHSVAHAEGGEKRPNADWGVNRRVVTEKGYEQVEGTFSGKFGLPYDKDGKMISGDNINSPTVYFGGKAAYTALANNDFSGDSEVDAGYQYDQLPALEPTSPLRGKIKGWSVFLRLSNKDYNQKAGYCPVVFAGFGVDANGQTVTDPTTGKPLKQVYNWASGEATTIDTKMQYIVYTGDDPTTTVVEQRGWFGLKLFNFPATGKDETVYWVPFIPKGNDVGKFFGEEITVSLAQPANQNDTILHMVSVQGLDLRSRLIIGTESLRMIEIDPATNTVKLDPAFAIKKPPLNVGQPAYNAGQIAKQKLDYARAYDSHPVAPWGGKVVFDPTRLGEIRVKRSSGITRDENKTDELDGAWFDCTFANGKVTKLNGNSLDWVEADVDHGLPVPLDGMTGYDAHITSPFPDDDAWDKRWVLPSGDERKTGPSRTIVEFPNLNVTNTVARTDVAASRNALTGTKSRYTEERVFFNLGTVTRLQGEAMK